MSSENKLSGTLEKLESILREDPRIEESCGERGPKEWLFTKRVVAWLSKLESHVSDALLVATWGHVLYRWELPRGTYPKTTVGYHQWRRAQVEMSATKVDKILGQEGYSEEFRKRVRELILKSTFPQDPDAQALEDATCLAFIEMKLESYVEEWEKEGKMERILQGTLEKMTPKAVELAKTISHGPHTKRLLTSAP